MAGRKNFRTEEHGRQAAYMAAMYPGLGGHDGRPIVFAPEHRDRNLFGAIHDTLGRGIVWHRYLAHGASSQACCLNFLMPLAREPKPLMRLVEMATGRKPVRMLPADHDTGALVDFEFVGRSNYLNEWGRNGPTRGANITSADAILRFDGGAGEEALLIEWKYTENDQGRIPNKKPKAAVEGRTYGDETRRERYSELFHGTASPFRAERQLSLDDFFYHPFYQLLRQQMLAAAMEADDQEPARRVTVLHIAPSGNEAVRRITAPRFKELAASLGMSSAYDVFRACLKDEDRFVSRSTEELFNPLLEQDDVPAEWRKYIRARYAFLADHTPTRPGFE